MRLLSCVFSYALRLVVTYSYRQFYYCCYYCYGYSDYCLVQHSAVAANHRGLQLGSDHHQSATRAQNGGQTMGAPMEYGCLDMGTHTSCCCTHTGRTHSTSLFFSHCASFVSISTWMCRPWPSSTQAESELGSLEDLGMSLPPIPAFRVNLRPESARTGPQKYPSGRRFAHLNAPLGTRRAPNVFRALRYVLLTAPFECGSRRFRYIVQTVLLLLSRQSYSRK